MYCARHSFSWQEVELSIFVPYSSFPLLLLWPRSSKAMSSVDSLLLLLAWNSQLTHWWRTRALLLCTAESNYHLCRAMCVFTHPAGILCPYKVRLAILWDIYQLVTSTTPTTSGRFFLPISKNWQYRHHLHFTNQIHAYCIILVVRKESWDNRWIPVEVVPKTTTTANTSCWNLYGVVVKVLSKPLIFNITLINTFQMGKPKQCKLLDIMYP